MATNVLLTVIFIYNIRVRRDSNGNFQKIQRFKNRKGLTLERLANILGTTKTTLSRYENNKRIPDSEFIKTAAKYFNVSTDYLLGISDNRQHYEITDVEEAMEILLNQPGLMLKGEALDDEDKIILANAIQAGLRWQMR